MVDTVYKYIVDQYNLKGVAPHKANISKGLGMHHQQVHRILEVLIAQHRVRREDEQYYLPYEANRSIDNAKIREAYKRMAYNKSLLLLRELPDEMILDKGIELLGEMFRRGLTIGDVAARADSKWNAERKNRTAKSAATR